MYPSILSVFLFHLNIYQTQYYQTLHNAILNQWQLTAIQIWGIDLMTIF